MEFENGGAELRAKVTAVMTSQLTNTNNLNKQLERIKLGKN